jgi:AcrR family transcriptional regulator
MDGFERRRERKKESIRRAALELFRRYGFEKVSVRDIAQEANVSPVTIYNHFGSKDNLVREVIKNLLHTILNKYRGTIRGEGTFRQKLETIVFDKLKLMEQFRGELVQAVIRSDPDMRGFIESLWQDEMYPMVVEFFEQGRREGQVDSELSDRSIMAYYDILRYGVFAYMSTEDATQNAKLMRELMSIFLYGLVGRSGGRL